MSNEQESLLESLSKAIDTCEEMHNDSRTPLDDALALTPDIRKLLEVKRTLRRQAFQADNVKNEYVSAMDALNVINRSVKAEILAHQKTMQFVNNAAAAAAAVLDLAIAVAKFA